MSEPCTACLERRCVLHEHGTDPNTFDLSGMFGPSPTMDLKKSTILWRQQTADEAEEHARLIREIEHEQRKTSF
jgi:hypothetical protein